MERRAGSCSCSADAPLACGLAAASAAAVCASPPLSEDEKPVAVLVSGLPSGAAGSGAPSRGGVIASSSVSDDAGSAADGENAPWLLRAVPLSAALAVVKGGGLSRGPCLRGRPSTPPRGAPAPAVRLDGWLAWPGFGLAARSLLSHSVPPAWPPPAAPLPLLLLGAPPRPLPALPAAPPAPLPPAEWYG